MPDILTPNEAKCARGHAAAMDLFVVGRIEVLPGNRPQVQGGKVVHRGPWGLERHTDRLKPTGYTFRLPRRTSV